MSVVKIFKKSEVWSHHGKRYWLGLVCHRNRTNRERVIEKERMRLVGMAGSPLEIMHGKPEPVKARKPRRVHRDRM